ncbi:MAG: PAS domain S-box protein [Acidobacteria bacterium]|nr:PAS domain S-box protein [Acidobacteriota bacterium]
MAVQPLTDPTTFESPSAGEGPSAPVGVAPSPRPPDVSDTSDASWLGRSVDVVGWSILVGMLLATVRDPVLGITPQLRPLTFLGVAVLVVGAALWLNRRGHTRRAAQVLALTLPVLAASLALATGRGFRDPAILMMPASLILCGVLLDRGTLAVSLVVTVVATTGVLLAEGQGIIAGVGGPDVLVGDILDSLVILAITGIGVGIVVGRLRRGMERLRRQETALRTSELRYRSLVDLAADAIVLASRTDGIIEANRRASELSGYGREEILGRTIESFFSPAELERVPFEYAAVDRGETVVAERVLTRKDGSVVPVEMNSKRMPDGIFQSILRDASGRHRAEAERRSLEARLRQAQKMEAVGRLAGGVAHDFNNLLTAITGNLTLALRRVPEESPVRRWLTEVDQSAWRAAALTRHLLAFSRQQVIEPKVLDLRTVVDGMESLVARTIGEDVRLRVRLASEPCRVLVDHGQMEQVVLNLVTNARDAMPDGGLLTLEVERATPPHLPPPSAHREPGGPPLVVLSVSDTGHGMPDDVRGRIFEPFFTTKPSGTGTGLGLAMVYGAAEQNGGWIDVDSIPGRGSTFRLYLPEAPAESETAPTPGAEEALRGTETVLLVEDDPAVREVTGEQLESLGYRVLTCAGPHEALTVAAGHDGPLHLLLTDVVMPEMDGRELAIRLTESRKGLRVLYASGYGEDVIARHGVVEGGVLLLQKPYSLEALAQKVRRALRA